MPHQRVLGENNFLFSSDKSMDVKTSDFLIRFRGQRPSSRDVGLKSPED